MTIESKKGFTLIELIIVLAVLGVIALIAIPRFLVVQEQAKIDADYGTAASIANAAELYFVQDINPSTSPSIKTLLDGDYLSDWEGWQYFDSNGTTAVYIEIKIDTGGTVGIYANTVKNSNDQVYPKP